MSGKLTLKNCLIIHLERSLERKPQVRKLKKDLPYQTKVIEAIDGSKPDNDISKSYIDSISKDSKDKISIIICSKGFDLKRKLLLSDVLKPLFAR